MLSSSATISALLFLCFLSIGHSLECYQCQIIEGLTSGNPCQSPVRCAGPSVCLTGSFSMERLSDHEKRSATLKSCVPKTGADECSQLAQLGQIINIPGFKTEVGANCHVCETDGCNGSSGLFQTSAKSLLTLSFVSLFWCILNRTVL